MSINKPINDSIDTNKVFEVTIRMAIIFLIVTLCFKIIQPFMLPVIWGVIIAVAIFPLFNKFNVLLGDRIKLTATLYVLFALSLLIVPSILLSGSLLETSSHLISSLNKGSLSIPPPNTSVNDWPLIGEKIYDIWQQAANNLGETLQQYIPEMKAIAETLLSAITAISGGILQFIFSIILSGVFLANTTGIYAATLKITARLTDHEQGLQFTNLTTATIRSVAQGVLGVAFLQAIFGGAGMYIMDVPGWGLWTICILILAVAQLPPLLVLLPVIFYVFSVADTTPAIIFTIWSLFVSVSDGLLKPLLLGRGMATPTLIILLGAIGGMMFFGILGLFIGAIFLALGYELFMVWLNKDD
ncbi:MAG: AI-2E family transporter [Methyloprofundus sp.]|nr:AI-2E family transporter [Methyloprofundus sp.]